MCFSISTFALLGQSKIENLKVEVTRLQNDPSLKYGHLSITVINAASGEEVYSLNGNKGYPTASNQKIITALAGYHYLGNAYQWKTNFSLTKGNTLQILGSYDPSLGSVRYASTKPDVILEQIKKGLSTKSKGKLNLAVNYPRKDFNSISNGWIYEDIGNYYGAGCFKVNWRENSYDVNMDKHLKILSTSPAWLQAAFQYQSQLKKDKRPIGDQSIIYKDPFEMSGIATGKVGSDETEFTSSGSIPSTPFFWNNLHNYLDIKTVPTPIQYQVPYQDKSTLLYQHKSPIYDSIVYWFLRKSINLYGESIIRTLAQEKYNTGDYQVGISLIKQFVQKVGIDSNAIDLFDGSGLSPQNRVPTAVLAKLMQYARNQTYYKQFYNSLPIINDINMKSGSIHGVRAYTGYISSSDENIYTFAIVANNYTCTGREMQEKLWRVLDQLK